MDQNPPLFEESCRALIQDLKRLKDSDNGFDMCIRSEEILLNAGVGLIIQQLGPTLNKKVTLESRKLVKVATDMLESESPLKALEISRVMQLTRPRSSLKRSKSPTSPGEAKDEELNPSNKIRKTQQAVDVSTSFDSPEITTPIKAESVDFPGIVHGKPTKSPLKLTMRRISTVQSEPSYSPIRSSPVKRISRNQRKCSAHIREAESQPLAYSSQPVLPAARMPGPDMETLRVDISAAQWTGTNNFVATPSDHSSTTMSASFSGRDYGFYSSSYDHNPTSAPHTNTFRNNKINNDGFNGINATSNSFVEAQHTPIHNPSITTIDMPLMTPTDELDPSWNTPSSMWEGSPSQNQLPASTITSDCINNNNINSITHENGNSRMEMSTCMSGMYTSHHIDHQHQHQPLPQPPLSHHHQHQHQHQHPGLVEMHEGSYPAGEGYMPGMPVTAAVSPMRTTPVDATYHHSMMMAAAVTTGAYGQMNTPP